MEDERPGRHGRRGRGTPTSGRSQRRTVALLELALKAARWRVRIRLPPLPFMNCPTRSRSPSLAGPVFGNGRRVCRDDVAHDGEQRALRRCSARAPIGGNDVVGRAAESYIFAKTSFAVEWLMVPRPRAR